MLVARGMALVTLCVAWGCAGGSYAIELDLVSDDARDRSRAIELALLSGGCGAQVRGEPAQGATQIEILRRDGARPSLAPTRGGRYGVYALARDASCAAIAAGCTEVELEAGGRGTIVVRLEDVSGARCASCDDGACLPVDGDPVDGGAPDAARPDSLCPALDAPLFCDGFETVEPPEAAPWDAIYESSGSTLEVVDAPVAFGARAARAEVELERGTAAVGHDLAPDVVDGELWMRGFYRVPSSFAITALSVMYASGLGQDGIALQVREGGALVLYLGTEGSVYLDATRAMPLDAWSCLELHVRVDDDEGVVELFVDGAAAGSWPSRDTRPPSGFGEVILGIEKTAFGQAPATLFVDELAISRTRIGC